MAIIIHCIDGRVRIMDGKVSLSILEHPILGDILQVDSIPKDAHDYYGFTKAVWNNIPFSEIVKIEGIE